MATQALYEQLLQALERSRNFKYLPLDEQIEMKNKFAGGTDEQIRLAIQTVQQDDAESAAREEKAIEAVKKLKETMKKIQKEEIEDNKRLDAEESEKAAEDALSGLGKVKSEKKKFLGIF